MTRIFTVNTAEDLKEYEADKLLHQAYKQRGDVPSFEELVRKWVEHLSLEPVTPVTPQTNNGGRHG